MRIFLEYLKVSLWMLPIILPAVWLLPRLSKRYTAKVSYVIWLVLAVRLLIPWNLTLPQETAPIHVAISEEQASEWVQAKFNPVQTQPKEYTTPVPAEQNAAKPQAEPLQPLQIGFALWLAGVLFFALRTAVSVFRMKALLRRWETSPSAETKACFAEAAGETQPRLMVCPVLESPMAVGLLRTTIYLPHENYTAQEMEMIFRHELIHWRRKDLWYKLLLLAARSIHWCNPLVWLMAKRAERDLEISCDSAAVQGRDAAYRKAYGLMILHEAERSIERQAALTTCFTDGKQALQERLVEIMNQSKRKKGMVLVAVMLVLTLTCGCFISYGKSDNTEPAQDTAASQGILTAEQRRIAEQWAEALSLRDGKIRYAEMGKDAKAQFIAEQKALDGEDWNYVIGGSSPWVDSYTIEERENAAMITYTMQDSEPAYYTMKELLKFGQENGKTVVAGYLTSNLYWEDGKVHPTVSRTESDLDEGIWDFLSQSVVGFISQSGWDVYELEAFNFNRISVTRTPLANGREQVTVDFGLNIQHRNPFRDPDEAGYIRRAKEEGQPIYQTYYKEYYEEKDANTYFRFTCEVQPDAQKIYEDTCYPETFHLYNDDFDPKKITFEKKNPAWDGWYDEAPADGWFCTVTPAKEANTVTVARKIRIEDTTGRTNNGYFDLNLDYTTTFPVAADATFTMGEAGETPTTLTAQEWLQWLKKQHGDFTLSFGKDANGNTVITEGRQGLWTKEKLPSVNIPSGYPTDATRISAAFSAQNPEKQHMGVDFATGGKISVRATADGIVTEAQYDKTLGYYVKLNHLNGFTTLYGHLSKIDVAVGDSVQKGDTLGKTGQTGTATGIICHYEVQLHENYQNPENYLK